METLIRAKNKKSFQVECKTEIKWYNTSTSQIRNLIKSQCRLIVLLKTIVLLKSYTWIKIITMKIFEFLHLKNNWFFLELVQKRLSFFSIKHDWDTC